mmetsp:Transcript_6164/g.20663  ORF Transcript_6164/g.20663 Transcript_6164/m.20663 type:complete len:312 (-) Transcript_6164:124-1059(-)
MLFQYLLRFFAEMSTPYRVNPHVATAISPALHSLIFFMTIDSMAFLKCSGMTVFPTLAYAHTILAQDFGGMYSGNIFSNKSVRCSLHTRSNPFSKLIQTDSNPPFSTNATFPCFILAMLHNIVDTILELFEKPSFSHRDNTFSRNAFDVISRSIASAFHPPKSSSPSSPSSFLVFFFFFELHFLPKRENMVDTFTSDTDTSSSSKIFPICSAEAHSKIRAFSAVNIALSFWLNSGFRFVGAFFALLLFVGAPKAGDFCNSILFFLFSSSSSFSCARGIKAQVGAAPPRRRCCFLVPRIPLMLLSEHPRAER